MMNLNLCESCLISDFIICYYQLISLQKILYENLFFYLGMDFQGFRFFTSCFFETHLNHFTLWQGGFEQNQILVRGLITANILCIKDPIYPFEYTICLLKMSQNFEAANQEAKLGMPSAAEPSKKSSASESTIKIQNDQAGTKLTRFPIYYQAMSKEQLIKQLQRQEELLQSQIEETFRKREETILKLKMRYRNKTQEILDLKKKIEQISQLSKQQRARAFEFQILARMKVAYSQQQGYDSIRQRLEEPRPQNQVEDPQSSQEIKNFFLQEKAKCIDLILKNEDQAGRKKLIRYSEEHNFSVQCIYHSHEIEQLQNALQDQDYCIKRLSNSLKIMNQLALSNLHDSESKLKNLLERTCRKVEDQNEKAQDRDR